jgi:hypothetical protein
MTKRIDELQKELASIPADYQETLRQAIEAALQNAGQNGTDSDALAYLRQRLAQVAQGEYIQPDGRSGMITLGPEETFEHLWQKFSTDATAPEDAQREKRTTLLKLGGMALLVVVLLALFLNGRARREGAVVETPPEEEAVAAVVEPGEVPPTPTLVAPVGADDTLQTIGGLGGSLTLGRPGALEIRYMATEERVALPIDPARISSKGELPYNGEAMASDSPVAVWVFGTVLNYAMGLPPGLVQALQPGDRLRLSTDTGATLSFVVVETGTRANHETADLLSQDRVGMTLFGLPAPAAAAVPVAVAGYDLAGEEAQTTASLQPGEAFFPGSNLKLNEVTYSDSRSGGMEVTVQGAGQGAGMLALHGASHQTTAVPLPEADPWQITFALPEAVVGQPLTAVYRELPQGNSAVIDLNIVPRLLDGLVVAAPQARWQAETGQMVVTVEVTNPGPGLVRVPGDYLQIPREGGDAYEGGMMTAVGERYLAAGESQTWQLAFVHPGPDVPLVVQIDRWLWGR